MPYVLSGLILQNKNGSGAHAYGLSTVEIPGLKL